MHATPIHDHVAGCVFGVIQRAEDEEIFTLDEANDCLVPAGMTANWVGDVSGSLLPPTSTGSGTWERDFVS